MTNIVFCADGTWNRPGTDDSADQVAYSTNVFKLFAQPFRGLQRRRHRARTTNRSGRRSTPPDDVVQAAKYIHGVGDSDNPLINLSAAPWVSASSPASCAAIPSFPAITRGDRSFWSVSAAEPIPSSARRPNPEQGTFGRDATAARDRQGAGLQVGQRGLVRLSDRTVRPTRKTLGSRIAWRIGFSVARFYLGAADRASPAR